MVCDVFISYAHIDNEAAEGPPFVSRLKKFIETEGKKYYGDTVEVFYDGVLESGTQWRAAIFDELSNCRVFLPIVSPSWARSPWSGNEWDAVAARVKQDQELGPQTRIVPVAYLLDKGSKANLPERVKSLEVKRYFQGVMSDHSFRMEADLLTQEIVGRLKMLDKNENREPDGNTLEKKAPDGEDCLNRRGPNKATVFLGFVFSEAMKESRKRIETELGDRGYGVREVELDLSWTAQQVINGIERQVDGCAAAVHFLEESPGPTFSGDSRSLLQIQCDLAKQWESKRSNLFWTGPLPAEKLQKYPTFVRDLKYNNDPIGQFGSSLLDYLRVQEQRTDQSLRPKRSAQPIIWVICERGDLEVAPDIVRFFADMGWAAFVPGYNARETPYSKIFEKESYFFFYWGKGEKDWCQINYEELVDARRVGDGFIPPRAALVYNGRAKLDYKENFQWLFLKAPEYDRFNPRALKVQEFVTKVESTFNPSSAQT